jgi:ammonia channel protein AmtB
MLISALTAPIYARSLLKVLFRRKLTFNVTAKGSSASPDRLLTFRYSLMWAVVPIAILSVAYTRHRPYAMMIGWTFIILTVCLAPVAVWLFERTRGQSRKPHPNAQLTPELTPRPQPVDSRSA